MKVCIIIYDTDVGLSAEPVENEAAGKLKLYKNVVASGGFDAPDDPISDEQRDELIDEWLGEDGRIHIQEIEFAHPYENLMIAGKEYEDHIAICGMCPGSPCNHGEFLAHQVNKALEIAHKYYEEHDEPKQQTASAAS